MLSDYPAARLRLQVHHGKLIAAQIGPVETRLRITRDGEMELAGETGAASAVQTPDVSFTVSTSLLVRLATKDPAAISQILVTGDSELAATLTDIARNIEWDIEADLSRVVGDVVAHRVVASANRARAWQIEAGQRLTANMAEYLTEERQAFTTARELEQLTRQNETLRDDIARLDGRVARIKSGE